MSTSENFFAKTPRNYHFSVQLLQKWGPHGPRPKQKTIVFAKITKTDRELSKTFYFIKISYVLAEL